MLKTCRIYQSAYMVYSMDLIKKETSVLMGVEPYKYITNEVVDQQETLKQEIFLLPVATTIFLSFCDLY